MQTFWAQLRCAVSPAPAICIVAVASVILTAGPTFAQGTTQPEAYVDVAALWPSVRVPVCWKAGSDSHPQEKLWVQDAVKSLIEGQSGVRFQGWEDCTAADNETHIIQIGVVDTRPYSYVGRQFALAADGTLLQDTLGRPIPLPTPMVLNLSFERNFRDVLRDSCGGDREHCIRAIAVHEFLHALGFLHEHIRGDADPKCKERHALSPDVPGYKPLAVGDYDEDSHMNYCANMYRKPIRLSDEDILVLNAFYRFQ